MSGDPVTSFYPVLECSNFLILRHSCQDGDHLISRIVSVDQRHSSRPLFDATKQVEVVNAEIGTVSRMSNPFAGKARHRINNRM
jgi:hypothetical protein